MNIGIFIYTYILFLLSTPNFIFPLSKKTTVPIMILYSLIFTIVLYYTYDLVNSQKEYFQMTDLDINGIQPFTKVLNSIIGESDSIKVEIDNDMGNSKILDGDTQLVNTPQEETVLKPLENSKPVNTEVQQEKLEKNQQIVSKQYQDAYAKYILPSYNEKQYNLENSLVDGCQASYNDPEPCCGQPGVSVSANHHCSKAKPICTGYVASENKLGTCKANGGTTSGKVSVLGKYNMKPWSMKNSWIDKNAQWIWISENADIATTPNSNAIFQYVYFVENDDFINIDVEITIACDCYSYMEFKNGSYNLMEPIVQAGTGNGEGRKIKSTISNGENIMNIYCCNNSYDNKPSGLLVTVTSQNKQKILFSTDDSWTWYQTVPSMNSIILKNTETYLPIVALWSNKSKGFLTINANDNVDLLKTNVKKLNNTFACERVYFQYQKNSDNTISLYSCANGKYISLSNGVGVSSTNNASTKLMVKKNVNNSGSFYNANIPDKRYLSLKGDLFEISENNDELSEWEIMYIDIIKVGTKKQIDNVPKYIDYVGTTPLDVGTRTNATFLSKLYKEQSNSYTNKLQITRIDANYYSSWTQDLLLPGINKDYFNKVIPKLELIMNVKKMAIQQIVFYNNIMLCMDYNGIIYTQNTNTDNNPNSWRQIRNATINMHGKISGLGGNMVIGQFNNKDVLFVIGPLITVSWSETEKFGAIYYRTIDSLHDANEKWKLYSAQNDGSAIVNYTKVYYCKKNKKVYAFSRGRLYEINYNNGSILQTLIKTSPSNEYILYLLKKTGGYIFGINDQLQIFRQPIDFNTNKLGEIMMIANSVEVTKITIVGDIVFALGKADGKIYYVPLYGGILKEFSRNMQGALIDIIHYNDVIYAIDNNSNILKTQIVI